MPNEIIRRRAELRAARADARRLRVGDEEWSVYEATDLYDRRRGPALVFESAEVMRRVRLFPADWRALDDAALFALSWKR